jgi:hypothetical protein
VLQLYLGQDKTHVLGHLVNKVHLDHLLELLKFISHHELGDHLITHIG